MEVLFEYRGSRRQLTASSGESVIECVTTELHRIGRSRAQVYTANVDLSTVDRNREVYLLQKWSPQWDCYVDVSRASDISDGDKLAVVIKPKPPSKVKILVTIGLPQVLHEVSRHKLNSNDVPPHMHQLTVSIAMLLVLWSARSTTSPGID